MASIATAIPSTSFLSRASAFSMERRGSRTTPSPAVLLLVLLMASPSIVRAHGSHEHAASDPSVPIDTMLWLHMLLQSFVWLVLFPLSTVLGLIRHRLHVPLAVTSIVLTTAGYWLGHSHGGRTFPKSAHGSMANILVLYLLLQGTMGIYLRLHLKWRAEAWIRPVVLTIHSILGKTYPILGWVQVIFGITTLQNWCYGGDLGQCLAHYIMGSSFIAYSVLLLIMLKAGAGWLARKGWSQELMDSSAITAWGLVNAFTEHHGGPWTHKDLQHTLLGVVWFFGGLVGIWTSRGGRRSVFPAVIIIITGWAMSGHAQALMLSTMIHGLFGYTLMAAGVARIIEVCFVLHDRPTGEGVQSEDSSASSPPTASSQSTISWSPVRAFQLLPPYLLTTSGILFMSATDQELHWADSLGIDHITWGLIDMSVAFAIFGWSGWLVELYIRYGGREGCRKQAVVEVQGRGFNLEAGPGAISGSGSLWSRIMSNGKADEHRHLTYSHVGGGEEDDYEEEEEEGKGRPTTHSTTSSSSSSNTSSSIPMQSLPHRNDRRPDHGADETQPVQHVLFDTDDDDEEEGERRGREDADPFDDE